MPARSQAQRGYLAVHKGPEWMRAHDFDNPGKLPKRAPKKKGRKQSREQIARRQRLAQAFKKGGNGGRTKR